MSAKIEISEGDREAARAFIPEGNTMAMIPVVKEQRAKLAELLAAHRIAAVEAERARCAALAGAILRASASNYAGENGSFALDNVAETIEEDLMEQSP